MPNGSTQGIEERKQRTLEAWVNNPTLTFEEIAKLAGVSDKTFWRYRQDENYMKQYQKMCQARFRRLEAKAIQKLEEQLDEGNFQAVKYTLDSLGYKPTDKVEANVDAPITITVGFKEDKT